ncbi:hypothetical protein VNO80_00786 [Phaseolus coccineus]|uniref:Uncharacterized protein n=1 Tax=Phaseolus coccineus TaxID=3886 RepID=A0AAN9P5L9_PHACN
MKRFSVADFGRNQRLSRLSEISLERECVWKSWRKRETFELLVEPAGVIEADDVLRLSGEELLGWVTKLRRASQWRMHSREELRLSLGYVFS